VINCVRGCVHCAWENRDVRGTLGPGTSWHERAASKSGWEALSGQRARSVRSGIGGGLRRMYRIARCRSTRRMTSRFRVRQRRKRHSGTCRRSPRDRTPSALSGRWLRRVCATNGNRGHKVGHCNPFVQHFCEGDASQCITASPGNGHPKKRPCGHGNPPFSHRVVRYVGFLCCFMARLLQVDSESSLAPPGMT